MRRRRSTSCSSATLTRKGRIASAVAAAAICDGNSLAAPATAMPIAAVFKSRRRRWLISSYVLIVFIDKSPCFEDSCVAISRCAGANEFHLISPPAILDQRARRNDDVLRMSVLGHREPYFISAGKQRRLHCEAGRFRIVCDPRLILDFVRCVPPSRWLLQYRRIDRHLAQAFAG